MEAQNGIGVITTAVISAVLKIGCLVAVGARLEVQGMLNGPKRKCLSALAMDVCLPCLLFSDVLPEANGDLLREGWQLLLWPLCYCTIGSFFGILCCRAAGAPARHWGSAAACAAFPNVNGFPVSIISALGHTLPKSPQGFSPMTFLALIQLTDGLFKYTIGPMVFKRDLKAALKSREKHGLDVVGDLPLGCSMRSLSGHSLGSGEEVPVAIDGPSPDGDAVDKEVTDFGLQIDQVRTVEPEWSRFDSGTLLFSAKDRFLARSSTWSGASAPAEQSSVVVPLLTTTSSSVPVASARTKARRGSKGSAELATGWGEWLAQLCPPQVLAVLLALAFGLGPDWAKGLLYDPHLAKAGGQPVLGFVYGTAKSLGGGFVPLQMISLGGRLVNVVGDSGPLAEKGEAGPKGRAKLLRICAAVGFARMVLTPVALYGLAVAVSRLLMENGHEGRRPMAFWAPALIVAAMPTANNMSTMSDLIGAGRSISAAGVAMQLVCSPVVLAISLSFLIAGAQYNLASDYQ